MHLGARFRAHYLPPLDSEMKFRVFRWTSPVVDFSIDISFFITAIEISLDAFLFPDALGRWATQGVIRCLLLSTTITFTYDLPSEECTELYCLLTRLCPHFA